MIARRLFVRADAGRDIGLGHVMRSMAIAEEAVARGIEVEMVIAGRVAIAAARRRGYAVRPTRRGMARLDGVRRGDIVVIDGYHFTADVFETSKALGAVTVVVDERVDVDVLADVVVAPDVERRPPGGRSGVVRLDGPRHALVRREFWTRRRERGGSPEGPLLVTMGGSDPRRLSGALAQAAVGAGWPEVQVLLGGDAADLGTSDPRVRVVVNPTDVGAVFDAAGAAVSAAGSTALELLAMGQVCALLAVAEDQKPVVELAASARAALTLPRQGDLVAFVGRARAELADPQARRQLSLAALALVDGRGARRVVDTILAL